MNPQEEVEDFCPYCDEPITLLIDCSEPEQTYTEDCFVCCRPIIVFVQVPFDLSTTGNDDITVRVMREDD